MASEHKEATPAPDLKSAPKSVRIFSYPKIIFIWPTMVFALICGIGMLFTSEDERVVRPPVEGEVAEGEAAEGDAASGDEELREAHARHFSSAKNIFGVIFLMVFAINMLVMALDFPRFTLIAVVLAITTVTFLMLYLAPRIDFLTPLTVLSRHIYVVANAGFYFAVSLILAVMFSVIWITRYLDYWEVRPNEILHHHGPLSDLERYPTIHLKFDKEIPDVLEYLLGLGSGRLVLNFGQGMGRTIVLDHVLFINAKEDKLKRLMGTLEVQFQQTRGGNIGQ